MKGTTAAERELDAAGIDSPELRESYRICRDVAARNGRTYFLATRLLAPEKRPHVHALYALARHADDIVDSTPQGFPPASETDSRAEQLTEFVDAFTRRSDAPRILPAVHATIDCFDIDPSLFATFFRSMAADLSVTSYADFDALMGYVHGSAEVIGMQLLPILGCVPGAEAAAAAYARDLGAAFQLTNFIRDVGEDLDRGRIYLPLADLARFGLDLTDLQDRIVDGRVRQLLAFEIARTRELLRSAAPGIRLLDPSSRDCVRTALVLYGDILAAVERADYRVLDRRVSVGLPHRLAVFAPAWTRAVWARRPPRPHQIHHASVCTTNEKPKSKSSTGA